MTYFNPEHGLSLQYPSTWKTEQAQQDGTSYRYFTAPPRAGKPAASVTLVAAPLGVSIDEYARTYLAGGTAQWTHDETRPGARGKSYRFRSADGKTGGALLLLEEAADARTGLPPTAAPRPPSAAAPPPATGAASVTIRPSPTPIPTPAAVPAAAASSWVYGLHAQGETAGFRGRVAAHRGDDAQLLARAAGPVSGGAQRKFAFSLRVPPSWRSARTFSSAGTHLQQYTSPAFGTDKRQTVHASLTLTVEPASEDVEMYYQRTMAKLGDTVWPSATLRGAEATWTCCTPRRRSR